MGTPRRRDALGCRRRRRRYRAVDLADPEAPKRIVEDAVDAFGAVDIVVANHARSSAQDLAAVTAAELDLTWAVNTRATLLLVQAFARHHDDDRPGGRVVLFTSGQHLAPMPGELPYVATKGAIHQLTASLAEALGERRITVNCVNPGPVDTGYATEQQRRHVARSSRPDDGAVLTTPHGSSAGW